MALSQGCQKAGEPQRVEINAQDYGLKENEDGTPAILAALKACADQKAQKLIIPKGIYHFHPDKAHELYVHVTNNDDGLKRIVFPLLGFEDLEIDGQGSELIFHGRMVPFEIQRSKNIFIHDLSIDWDKPFHFQAQVLAVDAKRKTFDIQIPEYYQYRVLSDELLFMSNGMEQDMQMNLWFDPSTKATVYHVLQHKLDPWNRDLRARYGAMDLGNGQVRIADSIAALPQVGWVWVAKGGIGQGLQPKQPRFSSVQKRKSPI
ncbi:MAG: hypothetical protein HC842_03150 [Cytophagales bacterium]|nr:hypothetical protein [Cytophagales bacterium]